MIPSHVWTSMGQVVAEAAPTDQLALEQARQRPAWIEIRCFLPSSGVCPNPGMFRVTHRFMGANNDYRDSCR
jgi:hypothetical protein